MEGSSQLTRRVGPGDDDQVGFDDDAIGSGGSAVEMLERRYNYLSGGSGTRGVIFLAVCVGAGYLLGLNWLEIGALIVAVVLLYGLYALAQLILNPSLD